MNVLSECIIVAGPFPPTTTWTADSDGEQVAATNAVARAFSCDGEPSVPKPLHRLAEVRRQEGLTRRVVAQRLGISPREVERQENPFSDIFLSDLWAWQKALGLPIIELLAEPNCELSPPVQLRARLLLVMKTVRSIQQRVRHASLQRMVETLIEQMSEIMPDLKDIAPWPAVGRRRKNNELGQAFFRRLSLDPLDELEGPER